MVQEACFTTTIHNLPATFFIYGDRAEAGTWQDAYALGLALIDLFAPHWIAWRWEAELPEDFQAALERVFEHHHDFNEVRKQSGYYESFCRVLYCNMVLLDVPDPGNKLRASPVGEVVSRLPNSKEFQADRGKYSIKKGSEFEEFRALVGNDGVELVTHLIHHDEEKRWDVRSAFNSNFFVEHVHEDDHNHFDEKYVVEEKE